MRFFVDADRSTSAEAHEGTERRRPAGPATIELQTSGAPTSPVEVDDAGRFRSHLDDGVTIRLRVREHRDPPAAWIETSWITI